MVHRLNEWLDPRGLDIHAFWHETGEEREHPPYWHFWQARTARARKPGVNRALVDSKELVR